MFDDRQAIRVGAIAIPAILFAIAAVILIDHIHLRPAIRFEAYFGHAGALKSGADVEIAGRKVGRVTDVRFLPAWASRPQDPLHGAAGVVVVVRLDRRYQYMARKNGQFFISSKGVLGKRYLEIGPPPDDVAWGRTIRDGDEVRGIDPPRLGRVLRRSLAEARTAERFVDDVRPQAHRLSQQVDALETTLRDIEPGPGSYARLAASSGAASREVRRLTRRLRAGGLKIDRLRRSVHRAGAVIDTARPDIEGVATTAAALQSRIHGIGARIPPRLGNELRRSLARARTAIANIRHIVAMERQLVTMVRLGEGTIGGFLNNPEWVDEMKALGKMIKRQPWRVLGRPIPKEQQLRPPKKPKYKSGPL